MRAPRQGVAWTQARVARREQYARYMTSEAWWKRRRRWVEEHEARTTTAPVCVSCGAPWDVETDDLHHLSYDRLGHEDYGDLWPLCRPCHEELHRRLEQGFRWRRWGRRYASIGILQQMKKQKGE